MDPFSYRDGELFAEELPVAQLAERFGTPLYLYSRDALETHYHAFDDAFGEHPHRVCYAVKANSNLAVLQVLAQAAAQIQMVNLDAQGLQVAEQFQHPLQGVLERRQAGQLAADVAVDAQHLDVRQLGGALVERRRFLNVDAELVLFQAG